jgi:hypothetical protein
MGALSFSLDPQLVRFFKRNMPLGVLVETGTFRGDTLAALLEEFDALYSIELSSDLFHQAQERFLKEKKIHLFHGNSSLVLAENRSCWDNRSTLYWLDAHWCESSEAAGAEAQCPLLDELMSIGTLPDDSLILIDDARLFLCAPPGKHNLHQWPSLVEIWRGLQQLNSNHHLVVVNDIIVFFPKRLRDEMDQFCQQYGKDVLSAWDKSRDYNLLLSQLREKEAFIQDQEQTLQEKETCIQDQARQLEEKETYIQDQIRQLEIQK